MWNGDILQNKTALITGASAGIGFACARQLGRLGAELVINGRDPARLNAATEALKHALPEAKIRPVVADVGSAEGVAALLAEAGEIDILINNVGFYGLDPFLETPDDIWQRYFDVNILSGVRLSRSILSKMMSRGFGRIVFVSSEAAVAVPADMTPYAMSKTAFLTIARGIAKIAAGTSVTVNAVLPGPTFTEGLVAMLPDDSGKQGQDLKESADAFVRNERTSSLIMRTATAEEVAYLVTYLATPLSSATTGAALRVDSGAINTVF